MGTALCYKCRSSLCTTGADFVLPWLTLRYGYWVCNKNHDFVQWVLALYYGYWLCTKYVDFAWLVYWLCAACTDFVLWVLSLEVLTLYYGCWLCIKCVFCCTCRKCTDFVLLILTLHHGYWLLLQVLRYWLCTLGTDFAHWVLCPRNAHDALRLLTLHLRIDFVLQAFILNWVYWLRTVGIFALRVLTLDYVYLLCATDPNCSLRVLLSWALSSYYACWFCTWGTLS